MDLDWDELTCFADPQTAFRRPLTEYPVVTVRRGSPREGSGGDSLKVP